MEPKPVIRGACGYDVVQGFALAGMFDSTSGVEDARCGAIQIRQAGSLSFLVVLFLAGLDSANEILLPREQINDQQVLEIGLVNWGEPLHDL